MKRHFTQKEFFMFQRDLGFLNERILASRGEVQIFLSRGYFNLYSRGNSLAQVAFGGEGQYEVRINAKIVFPELLSRFAKHTTRRNKKKSTFYYSWKIAPNQCKDFFQAKFMKTLVSNIKDQNYSEDMTFEQAFISDNFENTELIIIDRHVRDLIMRRRVDILGLERINNKNEYRFLILEAKMANCKDLASEKVVKQIQHYVDHIESHFGSYKKTYELQYLQKRQLGFFPESFPQNIKILHAVKSALLIFGYSQVAGDFLWRNKALGERGLGSNGT